MILNLIKNNPLRLLDENLRRWVTAFNALGVSIETTDISQPPTIETTDITVPSEPAKHYTFFMNGSVSNLTVTLPTAVGNNCIYTINNYGTTHTIVACYGSETINGSTTITLKRQGTVRSVRSDGTNWRIT